MNVDEKFIRVLKCFKAYAKVAFKDIICKPWKISLGKNDELKTLKDGSITINNFLNCANKASIPNDVAKEFAGFLSHLFEIPCYALPNYLSVILTPSNPILHTTRLRTMFSDCENGKVYERNPLFYGEWTDKSSELLLVCDEELQNMLELLDKLDLKQVKSLKSHYESNTIDEITKKIRSIKSLHNLTSPMKQVENGWIPDFQSRYFTADFHFGLAIIEELASVLNFDAPHICGTMAWYRKVTGNMSHLRLSQYGIHKIEDIYILY